MSSFTHTREEFDLVVKIVERAYKRIDLRKSERMAHIMDLLACNSNSCKLNFEAFLKADDENFVHDFCGIHRHMNRQTCKLDGLFLPRFAIMEKA